jgi:hypothetical protein
MNQIKRITALATTAVALGAAATPALAAGSPHWSAAKCRSWQRSYVKHNRHASKSSRAAANRLLKSRGCTQRV